MTQSSFNIFNCDFFQINYLQQSHSGIRFVKHLCKVIAYCSLQDLLSKIRDFDVLEQQAKITLPDGNYRTLPQGDKSKETATK